MFFREQLFINICVNSDRESKSSSDDSSKDDTIAEADAPCTTCCPPKCCGAGTPAEVGVIAWCEAAEGT